MDELVGLDWVGYFCSLTDDDIRELAAWLAAELLEVGEFMEVVDRAYARAADDWRGRSLPFVVQFGRLVATAYARRKRRFAELMASLEDARMSGALPGEVAPHELLPPRLARTEPRRVEELLAVLERARCGPG